MAMPVSLAVELLLLPWIVTGVVAASAAAASIVSRKCRDALSLAIWGD